MNNELLKEVLNRIDTELPTLFIAMLEESCETVNDSLIPETDKIDLVYKIFHSMLPFLKSITVASFENYDQMTLNYRGHTWVLTPQSQIYQTLLLLTESLPR
jgi:hypothetical protein